MKKRRTVIGYCEEVEMVNWESQKSNQEDLQGFAQEDLYNLLSDIVCGKCTAGDKEDEACDSCPAMAVTSHLENQIMTEGIAFMKLLVKEWAADSIEK